MFKLQECSVSLIYHKTCVFMSREKEYMIFFQINDLMWAELSIEVFFFIDTLYIT